MKFLMLLLELHDSLKDTKGHVQDEVICLICWKYLEGVKNPRTFMTSQNCEMFFYAFFDLLACERWRYQVSYC